jgi:predicted HTH domain antitoxin
MRNITLQMPDILEVDNKQLAILLASKLYEMGVLSLGQAAEVAGISKRAFAEPLGSYNVSIFNYPPFDILSDVAITQNYYF